MTYFRALGRSDRPGASPRRFDSVRWLLTLHVDPCCRAERSSVLCLAFLASRCRPSPRGSTRRTKSNTSPGCDRSRSIATWTFENEYQYFFDAGVSRSPEFHETFLERVNETGRRINYATLGAAAALGAVLCGRPRRGARHRRAGRRLQPAVHRGDRVRIGLLRVSGAVLLSALIARRLIGRGLAASLAIADRHAAGVLRLRRARIRPRGIGVLRVAVRVGVAARARALVGRAAPSRSASSAASWRSSASRTCCWSIGPGLDFLIRGSRQRDARVAGGRSAAPLALPSPARSRSSSASHRSSLPTRRSTATSADHDRGEQDVVDVAARSLGALRPRARPVRLDAARAPRDRRSRPALAARRADGLGQRRRSPRRALDRRACAAHGGRAGVHVGRRGIVDGRGFVRTASIHRDHAPPRPGSRRRCFVHARSGWPRRASIRRSSSSASGGTWA